ncbi:hypothetical protein AB9M62_25650 [Bacillales bacterium AN1005]
MQWLNKNVWWIGLLLTILIAFFPQQFGGIGITLKHLFINYWLQISLVIIITLLVIVCYLLIKFKKTSQP